MRPLRRHACGRHGRLAVGDPAVVRGQPLGHEHAQPGRGRAARPCARAAAGSGTRRPTARRSRSPRRAARRDAGARGRAGDRVVEAARATVATGAPALELASERRRSPPRIEHQRAVRASGSGRRRARPGRRRPRARSPPGPRRSPRRGPRTAPRRRRTAGPCSSSPATRGPLAPSAATWRQAPGIDRVRERRGQRRLGAEAAASHAHAIRHGCADRRARRRAAAPAAGGPRARSRARSPTSSSPPQTVPSVP